MKAHISHGLRVAVIFGAALLVAACASDKTPAPLAQAMQTFEMAKSDPAVRQFAPAELDQAERALAGARAAARDDAEKDRIVHLSYVAEQRAKIAMERANARAAQKQIVQLGQRRERLLLDAQTQQALSAQERAQREAAMLRAQLSELATKQNERGLVVTLGDILFDFNGTTLKPGGHKQINRLAEVLKKATNRNVTVEGHTDSVGSDEYNRNLSQQRADVVRQALIEQGVDKARISSKGLGEGYPVATNATDAGRQRNRRVEIIIENPQQASR